MEAFARAALETDVLIIGAGGAGMRAAIAAAETGASVILTGKTIRRKAHTVMAEGGINAALGDKGGADPSDDWKVHAVDTWKEGQYIGDPRMIEILCKEAIDNIIELENWGLIFDRTGEGKLAQRFFGGHTYPRACFVGDRVGLEIMQTLHEQVMAHESIQELDEVFVTSLLVDKGQVVGATLIDMKTGEFSVIRCKAIVLATGGCGRIFRVTTNSWETVGNGYALAYNAGAELADMEMVQFHPTGMVWPQSAEGLLVTEGVRGEGGHLLNSKKERFMKGYEPKRLELAPRDVVSRAIYSEIKAGRGTEHGGVWLDITHLPQKQVLARLPRMVKQFKDFADIDITKEPMEVAPTAHYMMGGVRVDPSACFSNIKGLFAAGEAAAGVHGANRLGGNSLADILVFGKRAGQAAAALAKKTAVKNLNDRDVDKEYRRVHGFFKKEAQGQGHLVNPATLKKELQGVMWEHVGIVRNGQELNLALQKINSLAKRASHMAVTESRAYNKEWIDALNVIDMLKIARVIVSSALARKESRGAHFREDFPKQDDRVWLVNLIVSKTAKGPMIKKAPVPKPAGELAGILR